LTAADAGSVVVPPEDPPPLLAMIGIVKSFGEHRVLDQVQFPLREGEVHILAGENGAGKSTLMKILGGVYAPDAGEVWLRGRPVRFRSPREAALGGVAIIHQELSLVPSMSVADNIYLGRERTTRGWMRFGHQHDESTRLLGRLGLDVHPRTAVGDLPISFQQMIEIAKALSLNAQILVMDEPTSALNEPEVERLFAVVNDLRRSGCGIVYITHKLEEVYRIADRITVLRDGRWIATAPARDMPAPLLIRHMVGRELDERVTAGRTIARSDAPVLLRLEHVTVRSSRRGGRPLVNDVGVEVRAGEIVGLAGLQGSGNSDLLWGVFGAFGRRRVSGDIRIGTAAYRPRSPGWAIRNGMALVTNDRQRNGLVTGLDVVANATLAALPRVSPVGWLRRGEEMALATDSTRVLRLRAASLRQRVATLSGGNQQKVVLAKWMNIQPRVLLLDEPTRGVDVGAKQEIYQILDDWRQAGHAIVLITSEMPELLMLSDRIVVMHRGRAVTAMERAEATQERILHAAMGGD